LLIFFPKYSDDGIIHIILKNKIIILGYILISVYCSDKFEFSDVFESISYTFVGGTPKCY